MKTNNQSIVRKLLSAVPLAALHRNAISSRNPARSDARIHPAEREQNLNRIFMVRYRTSHL